MIRNFHSSVIEVLNSAQVNCLKSDGKEVIQIEPGSTPGYFIVEHIDQKELLKGEVHHGSLERPDSKDRTEDRGEGL